MFSLQVAVGFSIEDPEVVVTGAREIWVATLDSIIHPVAAEYLEETLAKANERHAELLVIELNTPGGLLTSTREIFSDMLASEAPVVVFVAPSGAQAASAGFFLLMAADVAAMAPGTNTGAAHPVGGQGEDIEGMMGEKVEQDAAATVRSLAARNGRDQELAEEAVIESRSFTADEALKLGLADLVVADLDQLLKELDGWRIEREEGEARVIVTAGATLRRVPMNAFQRARSALAHPNIAVMLLSLGMLGLYFELSSPGSLFPGIVGAIFIVLGLYSMSVLPVNYAGLLLLGLSAVLFLAEIKIQSYGLLSLGGVSCLVLGSLLLFKSPDPALRVSSRLIGVLAVTSLAVVLLLMVLVLKTRGRRVSTGEQGLLAATGIVGSEIIAVGYGHLGKVSLRGELWNASADQPVATGEAVEVVAVDGLTLKVRPLRGGRSEGRERATNELG